MAKENVLIMAVKKQKDTESHFASSVAELESLSVTAGGEVKVVSKQNRIQIHPVTYVGKGKIEEVQIEIDAHDIGLIIANDELSPAQLRNLNDQLGVRVIDRSQLILDIFASRAKTKEGQLQVELAQLQYTLPRLHGMGLIMSKLAGGIGTRGPGETQLETDQRHIRRRIDDIKRRLKDIVKQREQYRTRRKLNNVFQIAIVGYTNAGKSTLFNRLTQEASLEEDLLFATLDPLTRKLNLPSGFECLLTDTVGFLQDLPTALIAAFKSTLEEVSEADFLIHVVDATHEDNEQHQTTVLAILDELDAKSIPTITVYNKADVLSEEFIPTHHPHMLMSAYSKEDRQQLVTKVENLIKNEWQAYEISLSPSLGRELHQFEQTSIVESKIYNETTNKYDMTGFIKTDHPLHGVIKEHTE